MDPDFFKITKSGVKRSLDRWQADKTAPILFDVKLRHDAADPDPSHVAGTIVAPPEKPSVDFGEIIVCLKVCQSSHKSDQDFSFDAAEHCDLYEAHFKVQIDILKLYSEAGAKRIGPKPYEAAQEFSEECGEQTVNLVRRLDQLMEAKARRFQMNLMIFGSIVAVLTLVATVFAIPVVNKIFFNQTASMEEPEFLEPEMLVISQPRRDFPGVKEPMTANSIAPSVGTTVSLGLSGSASAGSVLIIGIENRGVYVRDSLQTWKLDTKGTVTLLALTLKDKKQEIEMKSLTKELESKLKELPPKLLPDLPKHLHAVWEGQAFEFHEGTGSRSPGDNGNRTDFRTWALDVFEVIDATIDGRWVVSGRSFTVEDISSFQAGP